MLTSFCVTFPQHAKGIFNCALALLQGQLRPRDLPVSLHLAPEELRIHTVYCWLSITRGELCSRTRPECSLQVFYNLHTHRHFGHTMLCEPPRCDTLTVFIQFHLLSLQFNLSVLDLLEVQPLCSAKLNVSMLPCRSLAHFYHLKNVLNVSRREFTWEFIDVRRVSEFQSFLSVCRMCAPARTFPPRDKLGTYKHMCLSAAWYPGAGLLLATLSHYSRCC